MDPSPGFPDRHLPRDRKKRVKLSQIGPVYVELVATWIESLMAGLPDAIAREEHYAKTNPDDKNAANQAAYWRNAYAYGKWLAYMARTSIVDKRTQKRG